MIFEDRVRESLRRGDANDEAAEQRAWRVVSAALPEPSERSGRPVRRRAFATVAAAALLVVALAFSPPGAALADWLGESLGVREAARHSPASPVLRDLPGGGELLARSPGGAWIVRPDGSRRRLGRYRDVAWSPRGLFVAATRPRQLLALTPDGDPRWALATADKPRQPRWSPSGLRIAYLSAGRVRVVGGDGTGDQTLLAPAGATAPAWRPSSSDEIAVVDRARRVALLSAVTGRRLWRTRPGSSPAGLSWSSDGSKLAVTRVDGVEIVDGASGRATAALRPPRSVLFNSAVYAPRGERIAVIARRRDGDSVHIASGDKLRRIFATGAALNDPHWSPDGRWLLVDSPVADQWLFLRTTDEPRVIAVSNIARQLDPASFTAGAPTVAGWCCDR
jgi:dipeptidyl aminopeptidase/acylaminoacyl peptidase